VVEGSPEVLRDVDSLVIVQAILQGPAVLMELVQGFPRG
jgi:hypothetical protein